MKKKVRKETNSKKKISKKINPKNIPTLNLKSEHDIALDFATKAYKKFQQVIKSIILFGSTAKHSATAGSDIDIIIVLDDASVAWDQELIAWYREELEKILQSNPYNKSIHINTVKLSTWWEDLMRGDPILVNILRYGEALIDIGGFFDPLKILLIQGKIKSTPEAIYNCLNRAPQHINRSKVAELNAIEGLYWAMVDSAHAALIAAKVLPPSPEYIPADLMETFVKPGKLKEDFVKWYRELYVLHKKITHGEITNLKGVEIDDWQEKTEKFLEEMIRLVKETINN